MQNRKPLDLDDITDLSRIKVKFNQHKNRILNTKTGIFNSIIALGKELKIVKEKGFYRPYYRNFKDYCINEIDISWQTAYDYIKIYFFIEENKDVLPIEIAKTIGHRSLKLLVQKLSKIEEKQRKSILQNITEYEHYNSIKNRISTFTHG